MGNLGEANTVVKRSIRPLRMVLKSRMGLDQGGATVPLFIGLKEASRLHHPLACNNDGARPQSRSFGEHSARHR